MDTSKREAWIDRHADVDVLIINPRLVGGGARNPYWNQIHADILNRPVSTLRNMEATLDGMGMRLRLTTGSSSTTIHMIGSCSPVICAVCSVSNKTLVSVKKTIGFSSPVPSLSIVLLHIVNGRELFKVTDVTLPPASFRSVTTGLT